MGNSKEFKRKRSCFYLKLFKNDNNITLNVNKFTKKLIHKCQNEVECLSPNGWKKSENHDDLFRLWIPNDRVDEGVLKRLINWANMCDNCIWVKLNKNIKDYFDKDILDFCICSDWNYSFDGQSGRTEIGEVEYQIKYCKKSSENSIKLIKENIGKCLSCIDGYGDNILITTIPAIVKKQNKLSWILAKYVANSINVDFLTATLSEDKQQMKSLNVSDKVKTWRKIYNHNQIKTSIDKDDFFGKTVIIVDDLYQSGASMWCYAEYLKSIGVSNVLGIALVKSLKDSDNKNHI